MKEMEDWLWVLGAGLPGTYMVLTEGRKKGIHFTTHICSLRSIHDSAIWEAMYIGMGGVYMGGEEICFDTLPCLTIGTGYRISTDWEDIYESNR